MHYSILDCFIKSENAAKPHTQQSKCVIEYLLSQRNINSTLDFGCGKLRYSNVLNKISKTVTYTDSHVQISRFQMIRGVKTSVQEYIISHYPHCSCIPIENISNLTEQFDFITCINVLSAIPCEKTLHETIKNIKRLLSENGFAVFINQHKSSYFKKYEDGHKHLYGYLHKNKINDSYYGLMTTEIVEKLLVNNNMKIKRAWTYGELNFVEATCS